MRGAWDDFKKFALGGNLIELAIAFVLGSAFAKVVESLAKSVIGDLIAALGGAPDLTGMNFRLRRGEIHIGDFLGQLMGFLITAAVLFGVVKLMRRFNIADIRERQGTKVCPRCCESVDLAATKCRYCHSELRVEEKVVTDALDDDLAKLK